jgi:hypothetical protein
VVEDSVLLGHDITDLQTVENKGTMFIRNVWSRSTSGAASYARKIESKTTKLNPKKQELHKYTDTHPRALLIHNYPRLSTPEKNHTSINQDKPYPGQVSIRALSECKYRELL